MEEENSDYSKEILDELKKLNKTLSEELEREKNERDLQATTDSVNAEKSAEALEAKEKIEAERFNKISSYIDSSVAEKEANDQFRQDVLLAIAEVDKEESSETLTEIDTKLSTIVGHYEETPEIEQKDEVSYFTDLILIVFFLGFIPAFLAYKGLSKLFDAAMA